jgi:hypothetical protein
MAFQFWIAGKYFWIIKIFSSLVTKVSKLFVSSHSYFGLDQTASYVAVA